MMWNEMKRTTDQAVHGLSCESGDHAIHIFCSEFFSIQTSGDKVIEFSLCLGIAYGDRTHCGPSASSTTCFTARITAY